ncbi:MAG: hypothetical protein RR087_04230 [Oscillospiraceae bacterium]
MQKVKCPFCGYKMPITYDCDAVSKGVFVRCKGKKCKKIFEIETQNDEKFVKTVKPIIK